MKSICVFTSLIQRFKATCWYFSVNWCLRSVLTWTEQTQWLFTTVKTAIIVKVETTTAHWKKHSGVTGVFVHDWNTSNRLIITVKECEQEKQREQTFRCFSSQRCGWRSHFRACSRASAALRWRVLQRSEQTQQRPPPTGGRLWARPL